jgi:hypothetical protein
VDGVSLQLRGLLFDLFIPAIILTRRTRWIGFALATGFNVTNSLLFDIDFSVAGVGGDRAALFPATSASGA